MSVSVFCQNEASRIGACIASIATAGQGLRLRLTVIVNGSSDGTARAAQQAAKAHRLAVRVYAIAYGDKANAINHSFYTFRVPARLHVFVDGYACISRDALTALAAALAGRAHAMAATGVAGSGRTMQAATDETLAEGGRLHGQLHAFRPAFLDRLTAAGLRLPVGLYRGDGLLGSMACHDLDALRNPWDSGRIEGVSEAMYTFPQLSPLQPGDIARQFRRKIRQMRGRLENAAIKSIIYTAGYAGLPSHADDMIAAWLAQGGQLPVSLQDRPFMTLARRQHATACRPSAAILAPALVYQAE